MVKILTKVSQKILAENLLKTSETLHGFLVREGVPGKARTLIEDITSQRSKF